MARHKEFNEKEVLVRAIQYFWEHGYHKASMDSIVNTMQISRNGIYSTFGNKRDLYIQAIRNYRRIFAPDFFTALESPDVSIKDLIHCFEQISLMIQQDQVKHGCLVCNAAMEVAPFDDEVAQEVARHFDWMQQVFLHVIQSAFNKKEIQSLTLAEEKASFLVGSFQGIAVLLRSKGGKIHALNHIKTIIHTIQNW